jgi:hypothetical protein
MSGQRLQIYEVYDAGRAFCPDLSLAKIQARRGARSGDVSRRKLAGLSRYSKRAVSLDIDPTASQRIAGRFPNVTFEVGNSAEVLPSLVARVQDKLGFVLIDGDHSEKGVLCDINSILAITPRQPIGMVLHDSFMPACRQCMRRAAWASSPYVHYVEFDFVPGCVLPTSMVGGFAFALLKPERRSGDLMIFESQRQKFDVVRRYAQSAIATARPSLIRRGARRIKRMMASAWAHRTGVVAPKPPPSR